MVFIPNPRFTELYKAGQEARDKMKEAAEKAKPYAEEFAPVGKNAHTLTSGYVDEPGDYKAAFKVVEDEETGNIRLGNTDYKAHWIEFGVPAHNIPPQAVIANAVIAAGYQLDP